MHTNLVVEVGGPLEDAPAHLHQRGDWHQQRQHPHDGAHLDRNIRIYVREPKPIATTTTTTTNPSPHHPCTCLRRHSRVGGDDPQNPRRAHQVPDPHRRAARRPVPEQRLGHLAGARDAGPPEAVGDEALVRVWGLFWFGLVLACGAGRERETRA